MQWIIKFFSSSLGKKLIMSLTGLFLISFLVVHLAGNLQLLSNDPDVFNEYAYLMTHNPLIKFISYGLYAMIVLHAIQGLVLASVNRSAKGSKYAVATNKNAKWASKNMAFLGLLILAFLLMHMGDFWWKMKRNQLPMVEVGAYDFAVKDLYTRVYTAFKIWWVVLLYVLGQVALFFHLDHGFQSAFQTLGLNHKKYTPIIKSVGRILSLLLAIGFAIIPLFIFFNK